MAIHHPPSAFQADHPPQPDVADLVRAAHAERSQAMRDMIQALFGRHRPEPEPEPQPPRHRPSGCA